jgi:hypothetical protein
MPPRRAEAFLFSAGLREGIAYRAGVLMVSFLTWF